MQDLTTRGIEISRESSVGSTFQASAPSSIGVIALPCGPSLAKLISKVGGETVKSLVPLRVDYMPQLSMLDLNACQNARQTIEGKGETEPVADLDIVEITGLELLTFSEDSGMDSSNFSFDSYAQDSFGVAHDRMNSGARPSEAPQRRRVHRRMSNCSSIGEDGESYGYNEGIERYTKPTRRSSLGSCESTDFAKYKSTRRSSLGSYANDSVDYERYKAMHRISVGSHANGSVDYGRYKSTRRSSIDSNYSYANDSVQMRPATSKKVSELKTSDSCFSFSQEVYETQSINTGGASRAA